ncbi:MAG: diguanylate cyclase, partial [Lachnospiraceae bacterium]|nr:diguanylate cyclase [Lachnospiraceae bacterium]
MRLNEGLIYTNDRCIGCNRCLSACPVIGANQAQLLEGKNRIYVDGERCIQCGQCLVTCRREAREYREGNENFFADEAQVLERQAKSVPLELPEEERQRIFADMHKVTLASQSIDCNACGMDTCAKMALAIYHGFNVKENCVCYTKDEYQRMLLTDRASGIANVNAYTHFVQERLDAGTAAEYVATNFNIKNFKLVNQLYGSDEGDRVLVKFARQVDEWMAADEMVARVGEDTFVAMVRRERMTAFTDFLAALPIELTNRDGMTEE